MKAAVKTIDHIFDRDIWRVLLEAKKNGSKKEFEIISSDEYIEDSLRTSKTLQEEDVKKFALQEFKKWTETQNNDFPKEKAYILMHTGRQKTNNPEGLLNLQKGYSPQIRTNINLPPKLYERAKSRAMSEGISLSELIRASLITTVQSDVDNPHRETEVWAAEKRRKVQQRLKEEGFFPHFWEVLHYPKNNKKKWGLEELRSIARDSQLKHTGWPIGAVSESTTCPAEDGIETENKSTSFIRGYDYWFFKEDGSFYFARAYQEDNDSQIEPGTILNFDTMIWRVTEVMEHAEKLYSNLGLTGDTEVLIKVRLSGLLKRKLSTSDNRRVITSFERQASADQSVWEKELKLSEIKTKIQPLVEEASKKLLVAFNFFQPNPSVVESVIKEYKSSRM